MPQYKTPQLRFPEFSGLWENKKLGDVGKVSMCKRILKEQTSVIGEVPFYKIGTFGKVADAFIDRKIYDDFKNKYPFPNNGDILISAAGTIGRTVIFDGEPAYFQDSNIVWIANNENKIINSFLYQIYLRIKWTTENTTIPRLYNDNIRNFNINFPTLSEQQKIASFLSAADKKIEQLQHKKKLLEQYKKGMMQKLFSQQVRFKDDNNKEFPEWEEKELGGVGNTFNGLTGKTKENFGKGKPYIQYKQIFDSSIININGCGLVDVLANESQNKVQYGDVFFTTSSETPNEIGTSSVLLTEVSEMYVNSFCFGYRPVIAMLNPVFAQFLFRSPKFRKEIVKLAQGSTRYNMSKVELLKLIVNLPSIKEQTKIANLLTAIDAKINAVSGQLDKAKEFKKGLLQQMFV